jgi:capsular polysaccharide biosynthesis protein
MFVNLSILQKNIFFKRSQSWLKRIFKLSLNRHSTDYGFKIEDEIEIDNSTVLNNISLEEMVLCKEPSQTIVVPEIYVDAQQHKFTVLSDNITEKEIYISRRFRAPEMTLECLFDQYWFPESGFLVSKNGKVWKHSILGQYSDPHFLKTHVVEDRQIDNEAKSYIFHEHLLRDTPIIYEPQLITSHYASHNYGHYMLDMVPLIQLGMTMGLNMVTRPLLDWQKQIYQIVGVDQKKVRTISEKVVFLKQVFVSNRHNAVSTYAASPNLRDVFGTILKNIPQSAFKERTGRRLFLSRGATRNRNIRNRIELEKVLHQEGFEIVRPETLTFNDQALLFMDADIIISEFGAVMANVVFCHKGTKIIEIIPDLQNDPWSRHLCASLSLEHITLCHKVKDEDRESFEIAGRIHKDIYFSYDVNIDLIKNIIKKL